MARVVELTVGLVLLPWALWSFRYPRRDLEFAKKLGFLGIRNREQLELNRFGVLRNRVGASIFVLLALFLVFDSVYLWT